jgi:topoisomerase-4 subunit A
MVPRVMSLREALEAFIAHRGEVLQRRTKFRLGKIAARLEVLDGYLLVFLNLDKVIKIIRTEDEPKPKLMKAFGLTDNQAEAILNMRLRALRKLEEMQIRGEHADLTREQKDLKKLQGSKDLQSERLIEEVKAIDKQFGGKTALGKRRTHIADADTVAEIQTLAVEAEEHVAEVAKEPVTVVLSDKGWLRTLKGHQEESDAVKYREGDKRRFWFHAQTTDKIMLFSTDGRFFTLEGSKLPGGRGLGDPIRDLIELGPDQDLVAAFVHDTGRMLLLASSSGHGFVTKEADVVATTRRGKQVMNVPAGKEAAVCRPAAGDSVAVVGDNRKLVIFPLAEVPELGRGRGVILQRYKDGGLRDATAFDWKEGFKDINGRSWTSDELKEYRGARAQAGRIVPRGFASALKFA